MRLNLNKNTKYLFIALFIIILNIITFMFFKKIPPSKKIKIETIYPSDNIQTNSLIQPIQITFKKDISAKQKSNLKIKTNPDHEFTILWPNNHTLVLTPKTPYLEKSKYQISIFFQNQLIFSWYFRTPKFEETSPEEQIKTGILIDPAGQALEEAYEKRPWLKFLPIQTKNYSIDYLDSKKKIRVLMKIDITSPLSREEQIAQIKREVPEKLKEIGVDLEKETVYYTFTP